MRGLSEELFWFLRGESNIHSLLEKNVHIWDEWADEDGNLGPIYGVQWRSWPTPDGDTIDQISQALDMIKNNPTSRRIIVSAWNVADVPSMALPLSPSFPVLCRRWKTLLSAVSTQRRHVLGRSIQHRIVCALDSYGGPTGRP